MVEDGQCNGCFPNATNTNESNGIKGFGKGNDTFNELLASETSPRWWRRRFSEYTGHNVSQWAYWKSNPADLFWVWVVVSVYPVILENSCHSLPGVCYRYPRDSLKAAAFPQLCAQCWK